MFLYHVMLVVSTAAALKFYRRSMVKGQMLWDFFNKKGDNFREEKNSLWNRLIYASDLEKEKLH